MDFEKYEVKQIYHALCELWMQHPKLKKEHVLAMVDQHRSALAITARKISLHAVQKEHYLEVSPEMLAIKKAIQSEENRVSREMVSFESQYPELMTPEIKKVSDTVAILSATRCAIRDDLKKATELKENIEKQVVILDAFFKVHLKEQNK